MSALFPGLGQIYNRRYWKLPLIVGGYLGLGYATSWNNGMLDDYSRAYRDIMDNDPTTKSYMDFFPPTVSEDSLDKAWLTRLLQSRKNYYRRHGGRLPAGDGRRLRGRIAEPFRHIPRPVDGHSARHNKRIARQQTRNRPAMGLHFLNIHHNK